jgi:hypothetical protein
MDHNRQVQLRIDQKTANIRRNILNKSLFSPLLATQPDIILNYVIETVINEFARNPQKRL